MMRTRDFYGHVANKYRDKSGVLVKYSINSPHECFLHLYEFDIDSLTLAIAQLRKAFPWKTLKFMLDQVSAKDMESVKGIIYGRTSESVTIPEQQQQRRQQQFQTDRDLYDMGSWECELHPDQSEELIGEALAVPGPSYSMPNTPECYWGKLISLDHAGESAVAGAPRGSPPIVAESYYKHGRVSIEFESIRVQFSYSPYAERPELMLRFFLSFPFSPVVFEKQVSGRDSQISLLKLDFPLSFPADQFPASAVEQLHLDVWGFDRVNNEHGDYCLNSCGFARIPLAKLVARTGPLSVELKNTYDPSIIKCVLSIGASYNVYAEKDIQVTLKSKADSGDFSVPNRTTMKVVEYANANKHFYKTQIKPSYRFAQNIHTYVFSINGTMLSAVYFWFDRLPRLRDGKTYSCFGDMGLQRNLWVSMLKVAAQRIVGPNLRIDQLLSLSNETVLAKILGTALTLYSNYIPYIPDIVYTQEDLQRMIESLDVVSARDAADCEDDTMYMLFLRYILQLVVKCLSDPKEVTKDPEVKLLQKFERVASNYYFFACLTGVTSAKNSGDNSTNIIPDDAALRDIHTASAHMMCLAIPRDYTHGLLRTIDETRSDNSAIVHHYEEGISTQWPLIVCEGTGNVIPVCVDPSDKPLDPSDIDSQYNSRVVLENDLRKLNCVTTSSMVFYRAVVSLFSYELNPTSPVELVATMKRTFTSSGTKIAAPKLSYAIPLTDLLNKRLRTTSYEIGFWTRPIIPPELVEDMCVTLKDSYPLRVVAPSDSLKSPDETAKQARELADKFTRKARETGRYSPSLVNSTGKCSGVFIPYYKAVSVLGQTYNMAFDGSYDGGLSSAVFQLLDEPVCTNYNDSGELGGFFLLISKGI